MTTSLAPVRSPASTGTAAVPEVYIIGHVFKSVDGGNSFVDLSANLPDTPANWIVIHGNSLVVGTEIGVFISSTLDGGSWQVLGDLPAVPTAALTFAPNDPDLLFAATYGRGIWAYSFR